MSIQIDEWLNDILQDNLELNAFLMRYACWKCHQPGWAVFLEASNGRLITETAMIFKYPGVMHQFAEYLEEHPKIDDEFGEIKDRLSKSTQTVYLSHGCPKCDAIWGDRPLADAALSYWRARARGGRLSKNLNMPNLKHIFTVDLENIFSE